MNVRAVLTGKLNTSIIAFADDIILLNPSLGQLQEMLNNCVDFGRVWIEIQQNKNTICDIRNILIAKPKQNLREHHYATTERTQTPRISMGNPKKASCNKHMHSRISELWGTTSSHISSGNRWTHPATISTIAKGIIIPKLLYGIELSETTNSFLSFINTQLRNAIKSL